MLNWLLRKAGSSDVPMSSRWVRGLDLASTPKVASLLLRAEALHDETRKWFRETFGKEPPIARDDGLAERVKTAALTVAFNITSNALQANGRQMPLPTFKVDDDFHFVLAFNYMVLREILAAIANELDLQGEIAKLTVFATDLFLQMRPTEELRQWHGSALNVCSRFESCELANVKEFLSGISVTTVLYVTQLTSENPEISQQRVEQLFASQLQTLLSSAPS